MIFWDAIDSQPVTNVGQRDSMRSDYAVTRRRTGEREMGNVRLTRPKALEVDLYFVDRLGKSRHGGPPVPTVASRDDSPSISGNAVHGTVQGHLWMFRAEK